MKNRIIEKTVIVLVLIAMLVGCLPLISSADDVEIKERTFTEADKAWYDNDPSASTFTISTVGELAYFMELGKGEEPVNFDKKTIKLANDIVWNDGAASDSGFAPSASQGKVVYKWSPYARDMAAGSFKEFRGTFDGQGHKISGLYIVSDAAKSGFFGQVRGATVKNIVFENGYHCVSGNASPAYAGFVAGVYFADNSFTDITVNAYQPHSCTGWNANAGGIVGGTGYNGNAAFERCTVRGTLKGTRAVGGILGSCMVTSTINMTDCVNYADITAASDAAGITGRHAGTGTYTRCTSYGTVTTSGTGTYAANIVTLRYNNNGTGVAAPADDDSCKVVTFNDCYYLPGKVVKANDFAVATIGKQVGFKVVVHYTGTAEDGVVILRDTAPTDWANSNALKVLFRNIDEGQTVETTSETTPETAPETTPETTPETAPDTAPETTVGTVTDTNPSTGDRFLLIAFAVAACAVVACLLLAKERGKD